LEVNFKSDAGLWIFVLSITVLVSLMSGMYPSLLLSRFNPATALKQGMSRRSPSGFDLRRSLVVVQFVISQFFIMGTIVLLSQMNYFRTRDLGFRQDAVLVMPIPEREFPGRVPVSKMRTLRDEIATIAGVEMVSISSSAPSSGDVQGAGFFMQGEDRSQLKNTHIKHVDSNYLPLFDIQLIAGRNVDDLDTVSGAVVNERFANLIGASGPEDALGRNINLWGRTFPILGVVRDFHTVSLRDRIEPAIMMNDLDSYRTLAVRVNTADIEHLIAQIRSKWEAAYPAHIFEYEFLDENIRQFYEEEQRLSVLLTVFTFMAIFIGCLGLFGLASFMTNQRTKEIGVRKVLGASVESIILLFSSEYIKLILLGFVIAAPAAWYLMNQWLDRFAYKITIGPMVFFTGLFVTFTIAVLTVGYKSFKAAVVNPVKSLRYE
jgi:ABC-type antimicrobial peptide transport system permease subunit